MPWDPELKGRLLDPCESIADMVEEKCYPDYDVDKERDWTIDAISAELDGAPGISEELIESIVALWRLKEVEEADKCQPSWQDHLEAWLVRCNDC